jgi:vacuolar-type H+-ATPase subunit E/Vma4
MSARRPAFAAPGARFRGETVRADALKPTIEALLARAHADADAKRREAEARAAQIVADARREADALLAQARAEGEAEMRAYDAAERARARRRARTTALTARREALDALRERTLRSVLALRDDDRLRDRLTELARAACGPDAVVTASPDGGVIAEAPGRRVDCGLRAIADRAVDALGPEVTRLWTP